MRNIHRTVPLEVYTARTDEADSAVLQRLCESRQGYERTLGDHRAGITLIDGLPEAGAELSSALLGVDRRLRCLRGVQISGCHRESIPLNCE